MPKKIIALDTNIVIWGIKKQSTDGQEIMIDRAEAFLKTLEKAQVRVLIPSIVLSEAMVRVPIEEHGTFLGDIGIRYEVPAFDPRAASCCATQVWRAKSSGLLKNLQKKIQIPT